MNAVRKWLLTGLLVIVPGVITVWVPHWFVSTHTVITPATMTSRTVRNPLRTAFMGLALAGRKGSSG